MMTRRKARENAFIAVFEAGFSSNDIDEILTLTQESPEYEEYMLDSFALSLINNYYNNAEKVNEIATKLSNNVNNLNSTADALNSNMGDLKSEISSFTI